MSNHERAFNHLRDTGCTVMEARLVLGLSYPVAQFWEQNRQRLIQRRFKFKK